MKSKLLVATEKESSVTIRITPSKLGELLAKVQLSDYQTLADAYIQCASMAHDDIESVVDKLNKAIRKSIK